MLQEVLESINNYFVPLRGEKVTYTIRGRAITPGFGAEEGDRFLICGSRRNDGVYTWHENGITDDDDLNAAGLRDETFAGTIRVCSIPPALLTLSEEIRQWVATYGAQLSSPIAGESFNGYSYTLKTGRNAGGTGTLTWRDIYEDRLKRWRRPCL